MCAIAAKFKHYRRDLVGKTAVLNFDVLFEITIVGTYFGKKVGIY